MAIKKRKGELTVKQYRRMKVAAWSGMPIAGLSKNLGEQPFIRHLKHEVAKTRSKATGLFDIFDGEFDWSWDGILTWILENWQLILRIVLALLVFLDKAEQE